MVIKDYLDNKYSIDNKDIIYIIFFDNIYKLILKYNKNKNIFITTKEYQHHYYCLRNIKLFKQRMYNET